MAPPQLLASVKRLARDHCAACGYVGGPNWNPLEPQDPVAAFAIARLLVSSGRFDHFIAVAPEGHAYGYFFERLGVPVGSVFVDYPPTTVTEADGLAEAVGKRVLLIEDDVISGVSLGLIFEALLTHRPAAVSVYLAGRRRSSSRRTCRRGWRRCTWRKRTWTRRIARGTRPSSSRNSGDELEPGTQ